jgi:class 3 adenylate cyclase
MRQSRRMISGMQPEVRYARSGDVSIAYQVVGDGPFDVVFVPGFVSNVDLVWRTARGPILRRLASFSRLIIFDKRGTGMSDRIAGAPTLETRMDDVRAVMESAGSERAALVGVSEGVPMSVLFAGSYPERTWGLVLYGGWARKLWAPDYPWAQPELEYRREMEDSRRLWGTRDYMERVARRMMAGGDIETEVDYLLQSASPGAAYALHEMNMQVDIRHVLPALRVPTLVVHKTGDHIPVEGARYIASRIPGAQLVEMPGSGHSLTSAETEVMTAEVERFLTEVWQENGLREIDTERVLATILFTDIVGSSDKVTELGDRAWRELLERHHELVRRHLVRFRGREVDTAGDGFFASFDGPARAIRCARAVVDSVRDLGIEVRAGLHTGECELVDGKVAGIAVHTGARVASQANPSEVLVSSTVKDLVAGSGIAFDDRGAHELKGIPGEWRLFAVTRD